jgi:hypothetical protein
MGWGSKTSLPVVRTVNTQRHFTLRVAERQLIALPWGGSERFVCVARRFERRALWQGLLIGTRALSGQGKILQPTLC